MVRQGLVEMEGALTTSDVVPLVMVVLVVLSVLSGDLSILDSIYETQISQRDEAP